MELQIFVQRKNRNFRSTVKLVDCRELVDLWNGLILFFTLRVHTLKKKQSHAHKNKEKERSNQRHKDIHFFEVVCLFRNEIMALLALLRRIFLVSASSSKALVMVMLMAAMTLLMAAVLPIVTVVEMVGNLILVVINAVVVITLSPSLQRLDHPRIQPMMEDFSLPVVVTEVKEFCPLVPA